MDKAMMVNTLSANTSNAKRNNAILSIIIPLISKAIY